MPCIYGNSSMRSLVEKNYKNKLKYRLSTSLEQNKGNCQMQRRIQSLVKHLRSVSAKNGIQMMTKFLICLWYTSR